jgi:hypothetical protein
VLPMMMAMDVIEIPFTEVERAVAPRMVTRHPSHNFGDASSIPAKGNQIHTGV